MVFLSYRRTKHFINYAVVFRQRYVFLSKRGSSPSRRKHDDNQKEQQCSTRRKAGSPYRAKRRHEITCLHCSPRTSSTIKTCSSSAVEPAASRDDRDCVVLRFQLPCPYRTRLLQGISKHMTFLWRLGTVQRCSSNTPKFWRKRWR